MIYVNGPSWESSRYTLPLRRWRDVIVTKITEAGAHSNESTSRSDKWTFTLLGLGCLPPLMWLLEVYYRHKHNNSRISCSTNQLFATIPLRDILLHCIVTTSQFQYQVKISTKRRALWIWNQARLILWRSRLISCLSIALISWHLIASRDQKRQMKECDENVTFAVTMDQASVTNRQTQLGEER